MTTNILVTGGAGFIGSHFVRHVLRETDWHVTVLDKLDEAGSQGRLEAAKLERGERLQFVWHDLRAPINPVMLRSRGEFRYVVHMAAASHVDRSVKDPVGFVLDNVLGTAHLFQYCLIHNTPKKLLYFSTDEVFGPAPVGVSYYESDRLNPNNPYAASKAAAEVLCPAWANTFDLPITVTHCTNVYGPGQYGEKFIPLCAEKIRNGETVQIHARDGKPSSRYYVHVYDVCRAVMTVLMKGETIGSASTGRYNIAGDVEYSNLDVAKHIASLMVPQSLTAFRYELVDHVPNRPRHDMRYAVRDEKLRALGWKPRVGLTEGLRHVLLGEEPASPEAPAAKASPEPGREAAAGLTRYAALGTSKKGGRIGEIGEIMREFDDGSVDIRLAGMAYGIRLAPGEFRRVDHVSWELTESGFYGWVEVERRFEPTASPEAPVVQQDGF